MNYYFMFFNIINTNKLEIMDNKNSLYVFLTYVNFKIILMIKLYLRNKNIE